MTNWKFNLLLMTKLPIAWLAGLSLYRYTDKECSIGVRLGFLNQNPFQSMFWAVQGMAAELSSGLMCMDKVRQSQHNISMLVVEQRAEFYKKAKGKIIFTCTQGETIQTAIEEAIRTRQGHTIHVVSEGLDESNDRVSRFEFVWSFKAK